ncbi:MAG: NYN domain-containing protein [Deltaproteobacteria bacterium]|nr:NYN domain-containing protein [Deltaproteobacteria bacterium]
MILIVDGNNLIGRKITTPSDGYMIKRDLTLKLVKYVAMTGRKVKIVFDGIEDANYPDGIIFKGVQIFYAKAGRNADERIKSMVKNISYARDITVVSSDRELRSYVSSRGAKVMTRDAFKSELERLKLNEQKEIKESNPKIDNISEWLEFFGIDQKH